MSYQLLRKMSVVAIDLFCGTGGLTHGLLKAGIKVKAGYDIALNTRFAYEHNNKPAVFIPKSVADIDKGEIQSIFSSAPYTLIAGCAPCQPFSALNRGKTLKGKDWSLLRHFGNIVALVRPDFVTMENVPQLLNHEIYQDFFNLLEAMNYYVTAQVVYCPDYGIPQKRKRLVLLASRLGAISLPKATHQKNQYITVRDAIGGMPKIEAGSGSAEDPLHWASGISPLNKERLRHSKPGGSWEDWPKELVAKCHQGLKVKNYQGAYGRMAWDEPSPTITTQFHGVSHGRFAHPVQDRPISMREAAILQTFPSNYVFSSPNVSFNKSEVARMIGNAVPVKLGELIGETIIQHLNSHETSK